MYTTIDDLSELWVLTFVSLRLFKNRMLACKHIAMAIDDQYVKLNYGLSLPNKGRFFFNRTKECLSYVLTWCVVTSRETTKKNPSKTLKYHKHHLVSKNLVKFVLLVASKKPTCFIRQVFIHTTIKQDYSTNSKCVQNNCIWWDNGGCIEVIWTHLYLIDHIKNWCS